MREGKEKEWKEEGSGRVSEQWSTCWGHDTDRHGSITAIAGSMLSCLIEAFLPCSDDFSTAFLVHSDPVPLVVGTAIRGTGFFVIGRPFPTISK
jgi:hypothetical protein